MKIPKTSEIIKEMLFSNIDYDSDIKNPRGACYWLASQGVIDGFSAARFGLGVVVSKEGFLWAGNIFETFASNYYQYCYCLGVRPVIVLKSDLPVNSLEKIEPEGNEENWEYTSNPMK